MGARAANVTRGAGWIAYSVQAVLVLALLGCPATLPDLRGSTEQLSLEPEQRMHVSLVASASTVRQANGGLNVDLRERTGSRRDVILDIIPDDAELDELVADSRLAGAGRAFLLGGDLREVCAAELAAGIPCSIGLTIAVVAADGPFELAAVLKLAHNEGALFSCDARTFGDDASVDVVIDD